MHADWQGMWKILQLGFLQLYGNGICYEMAATTSCNLDLRAKSELEDI
jgi:hypothetical protein